MQVPLPQMDGQVSWNMLKKKSEKEQMILVFEIK
jgi:hypothetical protein